MTYQIVHEEGRGRVLKVYLDEMSDEAAARCGVGFNPSNDGQIDLAKALCVGPMEFALRLSAPGASPAPVARTAAVAATELEKAQMFLVKAIARGFGLRPAPAPSEGVCQAPD